MPLFSIIIPCYNQGGWLLDTMPSILNQSFTDWEVILVNDGSTDNTLRWQKNGHEKIAVSKLYISVMGGFPLRETEALLSQPACGWIF